MDKKYNPYNSNNASYEDGSNNEEDSATNKDGVGANATHKYSTIYTKNSTENYEQDTMDHNASDETPVMEAAEET